MRRSMAYKVCGRQTLVRARADEYVRCNRGPASGGLVALIARRCGTQLSLLEGAPSYGGRGGGRQQHTTASCVVRRSVVDARARRPLARGMRRDGQPAGGKPGRQDGRTAGLQGQERRCAATAGLAGRRVACGAAIEGSGRRGVRPWSAGRRRARQAGQRSDFRLTANY